MLSHNQIAPQNPTQSLQNLSLESLINDRNLLKGQNSLDEIIEARKDRFIGLEKPKTANRAFGSVSDFLLFFENRNHEIKDFTKKFTEIEQLEEAVSLERLCNEIQPVIRDCFVKESEKKLSDNKKDEYSKFFEEKFKSWDEFYGKILHVYTMNGFLYWNMNLYLRIENWMELTDLLPYTFCLLKAFLRESIVTKSFDSLKKRVKSEKLVVYRGAKFESKVMKFYDTEKVKNFSWHGVTSTSTQERRALRFTENAAENQTSVLFKIEVDMVALDRQKITFLDIRDYSGFPEEEIILAPGSIFELTSVRKTASKVLIELKLVTNTATLAHQGQFMHGMLQAVMKKNNELKVVCLKEKELSNAIRHCIGNQLIEELEFYICEFNKRSVEILLKVLATLKNLTSLTFCSVIFEADEDIQGIIELVGRLKVKKLKILSSLYKNQHLRIVQRRLNCLAGLEQFKLSFVDEHQITEDFLKEFIYTAVNSLSPECTFDLSLGSDLTFLIKGARGNKLEKLNSQLDRIFNDVQRGSLKGLYKNIMEVRNKKGEHPTALVAGLKTRPKQELLKDDGSQVLEEEEREVIGKCLPAYCFEDSRFGEGNLNELLASRVNLERLEVSFGECVGLTNRHLCLTGIENFASLTALHLNLSKCTNITDIGLQYLSIDVLQKLGSLLTRLEINIKDCWNVSNEGLMLLFLDGIGSLEKLASLSLSFESALGGGINDESLSVLAGVLNQIALKDLQLAFRKCYDLTELGLEALFCNGIQHLEMLENLNLTFRDFRFFSDKSLEDLGCRALQNLKRLNSLSLDFSVESETSKITSKWLASLSQGIGQLERLESLELNFDGTWGITSEGIYALSTEGLSKLPLLKTLNLGFSCSQMQGHAMEILCCEGLQKLGALTSLELRFNRCQKVGNESLIVLSQYGLQYLANLVSLRLSFNACQLINSEGLRRLALEGLVYLENLEILGLSFDQCGEITDEVLEALGREGLQQLLTLKSLRLSFNSCWKITSDGLKYLSQEGISKLLFLETLSLCFDRTEITSEGLEAFLGEQIQCLQCLTSLSLSLNDCQRLTGLDELSIEGLEKLKSISLDFAFCRQVTPKMLRELTKKSPKLSMPYPEGKLLKSPKETLAVEDLAKVVLRDQFGYYLKENPEMISFRLRDLAKNKGKINKLKLDFEYLSITDEFIREVFQENTIEIMENLTSFEISFNNCKNQVRNSVLNCLWKQGIQNMTSLETLSIRLDQCRKIKNLGVVNLCGRGIQHLKKLDSLELSFVNCRKITDKGLKGIVSEGIQHLSSLKRLSLNFNLCNKISDKGLRFLAKQGLQKLESLCILDLNFGQGSSLRKELLEFNHYVGISVQKSLNLLPVPDHFVRAWIQKDTSMCGILHSRRITDKGLRSLCEQGICHLKGLKTLCLNFEGREQITNSGFKNVCFEGLKDLSHLELNFDWCKKITDEGLKMLGSRGLRPLENLTSLHLSFDGFLDISDEGLSRLYSDGISKLQKLEDLNMSFDGCINVKASTVQGKDSFNLIGSTFLDPKFHKFQNFLEDGFKDYFDKSPIKKFVVILNERFSNNLKRFTLKRPTRSDFKEKKDSLRQCVIMEPLPSFWCQRGRRTREMTLLELLGKFEALPTDFHVILRSEGRLTDERLQGLCARDFQAFLPLTCLRLQFAGCNKITDRGIKSLSTDVLKYLQSLTNLDLVFNKETQISSEGLIWICQYGIQNLQNLSDLSLCLEGCKEITDEGIESLCHGGTLQDKPLKSLALNLSGCVKITESGFKGLFEKGIQSYKGLISLELKFNGCRQMKDLQLFQGLELLKSLVLNFDGCTRITDKGLGALLLNGMRRLTQLNLSFNYCPEITDQGIQNLCEFGIGSLGNTLTYLHLLFDNCLKITDKGINNLSSSGIKNLQSLKSLVLSFNNCQNITDEGLKWLVVEGIQQVKLLRVLSLSFQNCVHLTSEGLKSLSAEGIRHLKFLKELELDFDESKGIRDEGLESLCCEGLQDLTESLRELKLRFTRGSFTKKGVEDIFYNGIGSLCNLKRLQFQGGLRLKDIWRYGIERLEGLEVLDLAFTGSFNLQDLSYFLVKTIDSLKSLVELSLDFSFCMDSSEENLRHIPFLFTHLQLPSLCQPFRVDGQRVSNTLAVRTKSTAEDESKVFIAYTNEPSFYLADKPDQITPSLGKALLDSCEDPLDSLNIELRNGNFMESEALELFTISDGSLNVKNLTSLSLKFDGYSEMTDQGLVTLISREIKQLQSLIALDLSFIGCANLTGSGLKTLCEEGIRPLKMLTSLNLNFGKCPNICDLGLECLLSEGVLNFETLEKWGLGFAGCRRITDRGLISLCNNGLNQAKSLKALHLNFDQCQGISDEGLKFLVVKGIQARPSLSELSFSFVDCHRISYDTSVAMLKILNYFGFEKGVKSWENLL